MINSDRREPVLAASQSEAFQSRAAMLGMVTLKLSAASTVDEISDALVEDVRWLFDHVCGGLILLNPKQPDYFTITRLWQAGEHASQLSPRALKNHQAFSINQGLIGQVLRERNTARLSRRPKALSPGDETVFPDPISSFLISPIQDTNEVLGAICVGHIHPDGYSVDDERLMNLLSPFLALALRNVRLLNEKKAQQEELRWLASFPERNPSPLIEAKFDGTITYLNSVAALLFPKIHAAGFAHPMLKGLSPLPSQLKSGASLAMVREVNVGDRVYHQSVIRVPGYDLIRIYAIDITERKQAVAQQGRLFNEAQRRARQLALLNELAREMTGLLDARDLCTTVACRLHSNFGYFSVSVFTADAAAKAVVLQASAGSTPENFLPEKYRQAFGEGIIGQAAEMGQILVVNDTRWLPDAYMIDRTHIRSEMAIPLKVEGRVIGILNVNSEHIDAFSESDVATLATLGDQLALALEKARLYDQARQEIAERMRAEEQISASLQEKEVLLKEIHHRVKNNLQIISSLLNLQAGLTQDPQALTVLRDSQNRVRSMALIHEQLYQSPDLARIDFADYVRSLTDYLLRSSGTNPSIIQVKINVDPLMLDIDTAMPCGLIINELVSNALKHAFPDGQAGNIGVSFHCVNGIHYSLTVSDSGIGLPKTLDFRNTESLGLQLVNTLVDQLDGSIEYHNSTGTAFKITFTRTP